MLIDALIGGGLRLAAGVTRRPGLTVVTYHRVLAVPDAMLMSEPDVRTFRVQVSFLAQHMRVLPLTEALRRLESRTLPARAACITFDDGYANNYHCALPVLGSLGLPATVFVATGYLNGGCMWNDVVTEAFRLCRKQSLDLSFLGLDLGCYELSTTGQRRAGKAAVINALKYLPIPVRMGLASKLAEVAEVPLPGHLMLTSDELCALQRQGIEIGGHTVNHPILSNIGPEEARQEISGGADKLEEITGVRPTLFAYPNGRPGVDFGPEHAGMIRDAGFTHALTTEAGIARPGSDPYALPRISLLQSSPVRLAASLMSLYARG